jgi:hypothetical protein
MALLFIEGFDHHGNNKELSLTGKWAPNGASNHRVDNTQWRTGGYSSNGYYAADEAITYPLPAVGGFVIGVAIRTKAQASSSREFIRVKEGTVVHMAIALTVGMVLQVKVGATVVATGTTVLPVNSWVYIEFKGTIDATTGSYDVHIDTVPEATLQATGVNTRNGGTTGQWDRFALTPAVGSWDSWADDVYACDQSGTTCNDFLGPVRIETLFPQPGNGTNVGFLPSTGTDHGEMVNEMPPNTTDYNTGTAAGSKDTYNFPSLIGTGDVIGLQVNLYVAKTDAGARQVCGVVRVGSTDYDGPSKTLLTTFAYVTALWPMNPATGAPWTPAEITALEAGMKVTV